MAIGSREFIDALASKTHSEAEGIASVLRRHWRSSRCVATLARHQRGLPGAELGSTGERRHLQVANWTPRSWSPTPDFTVPSMTEPLMSVMRTFIGKYTLSPTLK